MNQQPSPRPAPESPAPDPRFRPSGGRVRAMFARITSVYDPLNHLLSLGRDRAWRRNLVRHLDGDAWEVVDLCAGTGDVAAACRDAGKGRLLLAVDFCPEMLQRAARKLGRNAFLTVADALSLPLPSESCDAVLIGFGLRNLSDIDPGLAEILRVLRPGGQVLVLDFFRDEPGAGAETRGASPLLRGLLDRLLPIAGRIAGGREAAYRYLARSPARFLTPGELAGRLQAAGCQDVFVERQTFGIAHLVGARLPL